VAYFLLGHPAEIVFVAQSSVALQGVSTRRLMVKNQQMKQQMVGENRRKKALLLERFTDWHCDVWPCSI